MKADLAMEKQEPANQQSTNDDVSTYLRPLGSLLMALNTFALSCLLDVIILQLPSCL